VLRRLTASGLERAELCIGSAVLPGIDESGEYAATGQAVDDFVRVAKTVGRDAALEHAPPEHRAYLERITLDRVPDGAEYQVGLALHAETGEVRRIPSRGEGYPNLGPEWIVGTADIVGRRASSAYVADLKWGSYTDGRDPATDLQVGFYGVCVARLCGLDDAEVGFLRAGWDGVLRPDAVVLDSMALDALEERIRTIYRRWRAGEATLRPGDQCTYCSARRGCDAMVAPTALLLRGDLVALARQEPTKAQLTERIKALAPADRGVVFELAGQIEERAKLVQQIVRDDARGGAVPLPNGKELREVEWGQEKVSPEARARLDALKDQLRGEGLIKTVKVPQVRPMKAARG